MALSNASKAGVALFVGVIQFAILEMLAEFVYPGYNVASNYISDLGPPCSSGVACPSSTSWWIFDSSIALLGILVLVAAYFLYLHFRWKPVTGLVGLAGFGALGVGIFNETAPYRLHEIFSLLTFLGIGLAALVSYRLQKRPMNYFSTVLGLISLISLVIFISDDGVSAGGYLGIGAGGLERLIVYPVLLWSIAFSGQLMATDQAAA